MHTRSQTFVSATLLFVFLVFGGNVAAAQGQMGEPLSSEDVSDEQIQQVAQVFITLQDSVKAMKMEMRRRMKENNVQEMDSTERAKHMRQMQMEMQKRQMQLMQQAAQDEGLDPKRFRRIMQAVQQDSTLQQRLRAAVKKEVKSQQSQMNPQQNQ